MTEVRDRLSRDWLWLGALLAVALLLRLQGLNWDQGHHLHPDERFLTMVAADIRPPASVAEYFDTARSPLNPANTGRGFFIYGTVPLFVVKALAAATGRDGYDGIHFVGRVCSALADVGTLLLVYRLALMLAGRRTATAAASLVAFSVISIQHAHFFTVDSFAAFFSTASLLALASISMGGGSTSHLLFGVGLGLTLACRINLGLLVLLYPLAALYARRSGGPRWRDIAWRAALAAAAAAFVFRIAQPYAFAGPTLFHVAPAPDFVASLQTAGAFSTGAADYPPSVQWIGRTPVLYPAWNLLVWWLGPAWGLASIGALAWIYLRRRHAATGEHVGAGRIVLLWAPLLFFFHATQFAATGRYVLPVVPLLAVAVAWWLARPSGRHGRLRLAGLALVVASTALWAFAFTAIYRRPHTRVEASRWIYANVPAGAVVASEHWDDRLPLAVDGRRPSIYGPLELTLYDDEDDAKRRRLVQALDAADVIVISSHRLYGSIPRTPWRYPLARRYYELLFSGELGFALERVFTSYPRLGPLEIDDTGAEEAFTVYDHPKVLVFRKTPAYTTGRATELLDAVSLSGIVRVAPREASALYRRARPTDIAPSAEHAVRHPAAPSDDASLAALLRWLAAFEVLSLACFALLFRALPQAADRGYGLAKVIAWLAPATISWLVASTGLAPNDAATVRLVSLLILLAGSAAAWRARHDLRPFVRSSGSVLLGVEAVFVVAFAGLAAVRAFNSAIFWGEKPMDFAILNAAFRSVVLPPADPWFAGEPLNYFYFGHAASAIFAKLAGVAPAHAFNLALVTVGALLAVMVSGLVHQLTRCQGAGAWGAALVVAGGSVAGLRVFMSDAPDILDFNYFWATSRVVAGTINEYPFWSLVFGDLHAHVLAMPLEVGVLYLGMLWVTAGGEHARRQRLGLAVLSAWLLGAAAVTSSWSLPTLALVQLGFLVTGWRLRAARSWRGLVTALATWVAILLGAAAVFLPFWAGYEPPPRLWGRVTTEAASIADAVTVFGVFLALALPALIASVARWARPGLGSVLALALGVAAVVIAGWFRSGACALYAAFALLALTVWMNDTRTHVRAAAGMAAAAGALGVFTETVFVWDRMNTVFKYYLEMWLLVGPAAVVLAWTMLREATGAWRAASAVLIVSASMAATFTSVTAVTGFLRQPLAPSEVPTLDGMQYLEASAPGEREAYRWLNREVAGIPVILEAQGPPYKAFGRVSMNTGLPTVLGWEYHLYQQGRARAQIEQRAADIRRVYDGLDLAGAEDLLRRYRVDLVFVGPLERQTYSADGLAKFASSTLVRPVFANGEVTIYATPGLASRVKTWVDAVPAEPRRLPLETPLREPRALAAAPDGSIVIADFGNRRVLRVGPDRRPVASFGHEGSGAGEFRDPCGIAVDAAGHVWVADTWNHRIQQLSPDGRLLRELRGDLYGPRGVAAGADGVVLVTDTGNGRLLRFDASGTPHVLVEAPRLDNPVGVAVNSRGEIFVADVGHRRVAVFDAEGRLRREWPVDWHPDPRLEPYLAIGPDDEVWVTDPGGRQVLVFDEAGAPLGTAMAAEPLSLPLGVTVVGRGTALVTDALAGRLVEVRRP